MKLNTAVMSLFNYEQFGGNEIMWLNAWIAWWGRCSSSFEQKQISNSTEYKLDERLLISKEIIDRELCFKSA